MELKCNCCGYKWLPRIDKPVCCPKCKRYDYEKIKESDESGN